MQIQQCIKYTQTNQQTHLKFSRLVLQLGVCNSWLWQMLLMQKKSIGVKPYRYKIIRGVGTGEAGEAAASPEIRGWQTNFLGEKGKKLAIFEVASPEIILFLRPCLILFFLLLHMKIYGFAAPADLKIDKITFQTVAYILLFKWDLSSSLVCMGL